MVIINETLVLSDEERSRLFDLPVKMDSGGRTMRLDVALALSYQKLRRNGAEVSMHLERGHGVTFRVLLKPPSGT